MEAFLFSINLERNGKMAHTVESVEKKWYVLHTYAGYENKVKENAPSIIVTASPTSASKLE